MGWDDDKDKVMSGLDKVGAIAESVDKLVQQVNGQEGLTQKFKQEIGDVRTELQKLNESGLDAETFKNLIDKVDAIGENNNNSSKNQNQGGAEGDEDWDESKVSEAAKAKAEEVFSKLEPEQRSAVKSDPNKRKQFLKAAEEATSKAPDKLFDEPTGEEKVNQFKELFGLKADDSSLLPGSKPAGSKGYADAVKGITPGNNDSQRTGRLPNGNIPRGRPREEYSKS